MPFLEIIHLSGEVERRPLEKRQPVSIGSHSSNDIRIDEDGVEPMHCRVSWNKQAFEAVAAGVDGLEVNGNVVQRTSLKRGDVLRFGSVDIRFRDGAEDEASPSTPVPASSGISAIELKPLSDEVDVPEWLKGSPAPAAAPPPAKPAAKAARPAAPPPPTVKKSDDDTARRKAAASAPKAEPPKTARTEPKAAVKAPSPRPKEEPAKPARKEAAEPPKAKKPAPPQEPEDFDLDAGLEALASESRASMPTIGDDDADIEDLEGLEEVEKPSKPSPKRAEKREKPKVEEDDEETEPATKPVVPPADDPVTTRLRSALKHQRVRPGEEDILRSPIVLGLAGTAVTLLLLSAIFYFIGFRRSVQEEFDFAKAAFEEKKYAQAIVDFNKFITNHPDSPLVEEAGIKLGYARIDQLTSGAVPNFVDGMKELKNFVTEMRESPKFPEIQPEVQRRSGEIALGAANLAGKQFDRRLLDVVGEARASLVTYSPKESPPTDLLRQIDEASRASEAAILKHETHEEDMRQIESALADKKALDALRIRRELLARYPDFAANKKVVDVTRRILDTERGLVVDEAVNRDAVTEAPTAPSKAITLVYQARTRTDQLSVNRAVPLVSQDSLFGIDTITGAPIWRQVIGVDSPFFPVRDSASSSLIAFDSVHQELLRLNQNTGAVIWRQPIDEAVSARPLLDEGQVFVPTAGGNLYRLDLDSGAILGRLTFSQEISNPVALADGNRLVVAGDREVFYTLTKRPFACTAVSYLGQPSGSIVAPLLAMGPYVLAAENVSATACRLRLLTTEPTDQPIRDIAEAQIAGQVVDAPVVRGRDLFIPSTGERVAAFQVSDDPGQPPLVAGPTYEVKGAKPCVSYLATAPDGEVLMASSALRKLQLDVNSLQPAQEAVLHGLASQPMQSQDRMIFVARRRPYSDGSVLTPIDRSTLAGEWQASVGSGIIASSVVGGESPSVICATESGHLFRITPKLLETGGFLAVAERLPLNDEMVDPLVATSLPEGQLLVGCGLPEPKLWFVNRLGQIERTLTLPMPLQAGPALMGNRILAPVPGRLQFLVGTSAQPAAQEYRLPSDLEGSARWKQVVAVDADSAVALLDNGMILGIRIQKDPRPNVAESGRFDLGGPLAGMASLANGQMAAASSQGRVVVLNAAQVEPTGDRIFEAPVTAGPWLVGDLCLVEVGGTELHALNLDQELTSRWTVAVDGSHVAGAPIVRGAGLLIPLQDGRVLSCDPGSGAIQGTEDLGVALEGNPILVGPTVWTPTLDGSLIQVKEPQP